MRILYRTGREIYEQLVFYLALLYFGVVGVMYTALCSLLHLLLPRRAGMWFGRRAIGLLFRSYLAMLKASGVLQLDLRALDSLRDKPSLVIAPNHPSLIDVVLIVSRLPDITCIIKTEIWNSPVLGGGARLAGYIRNDSPSSMVKHAAEELREGHRLLVFPEGTRTRKGAVNDFKGGFALIAKKSGAAVQTVFIETNSAFLGKGWPILRKPPMPLTYRVRLGRRFEAGEDVKAFVHELERYYRRELEPSIAKEHLAPAQSSHRPRATPAP